VSSAPKRVSVAEGQVPLFYEEEAVVEEEYIGPGVSREDVDTRAGTQLDHRWTHKIMGHGRRGALVHGLYDESQRIYQTGGELSRFVFWKRRLVTIAEDAWRQVYGKVDWLEVIDHERNECWRISMKRAEKAAVRYDAGLGPRVGIPMDQWSVISADGKVRAP
jgi:hypothetical protein